MPIGFWAISREELRTMLEARTGNTPSQEILDKMVRTLPHTLSNALEDELEYYAPQVMMENP